MAKKPQPFDALDLVAEFYDASAAPERWPSVLERVASLTNSSGAVLNFQEPLGVGAWMECARVDREVMEQSYAGHYAAVDPFRPLAPTARVGEFNFAQEAIDLAEFEATDFYSDFARWIDRYDSVLLPTTNFTASFSALVLTRPKRAPRFEPADVRSIESVAAHLGQAVGLTTRFQQARRRNASLLALLDGFTTAVFLLDEEGRIVENNRRGEALLRRGLGLRIANGRLRAELRQGQASLARAVRTCADTSNGRDGGAGGWIVLPCSDGSLPLTALVSPIRSDTETIAPRRARVAVYVNPPRRDPTTLEGIARATWGLTRQEARIAALLADGLHVDAIAERLEVLPDTVRTHLKHCFAKASVTRQSQLVASLWRAAGSLRDPGHG